MKQIQIVSGGGAIQGRVFRPVGAERPGGGLLFIHGLHSDQTGYAVRAEAAVDALGVVCLTFDLSGHGRSPGVLDDLTAEDHLRDVIAAYDYLQAQFEADRPIGVCGASYGAFMATLLIAQRRVERLLLRAPALVRDDDLSRPLGRRRLSTPADARAALNNLGKFDGEVLVLESGQDEVVPHEVVQAYVDACRGRASHEVIPDATHSLTDERWQWQFIETIVRWFAPIVPATAAQRSTLGRPRLQS